MILSVTNGSVKILTILAPDKIAEETEKQKDDFLQGK